MLRKNIISAATLTLILVINILVILNVTRKYQDFLDNALVSQVNLWGEPMEHELTQFTSDINKELNDISKKLEQPGREEIPEGQLLLYNCRESIEDIMEKYGNLITEISVINDQKTQVIYRPELLTDGNVEDSVLIIFRRQPRLYPRDKVEQQGSILRYYYPYFGDARVIGNIVVDADLSRYARKKFKQYAKILEVDWHWILDAEGGIIYDDFPADSVSIEGLLGLADSIRSEKGGLVAHSLSMDNERQEKVYTAYYPMSVNTQKLGVMFTINKNDVYNAYFRDHIIATLITQLLMTALIIYLLLSLSRFMDNDRKLKLSDTILRQILEEFPMGILVMDKEHIIRNINSAAQKMLFLNSSGDLVGQDFNKQFLVSNKYLLSEDSSPFMDDSQYLYYEKDGSETVIFKSEKFGRIAGEELQLVGLIDVSPIERSRKSEVAANRSKSDFLAAMSHEIRTPMNGILGMVNTLKEDKTTKDVKSKIEVIRRSSELLMTIINDILDFSKIEAGRMMLEEIPFKLDEELDLVRELFEPLAAEKGIELLVTQHPDVPNKLIGDPFRLRQVIQNLVSNAVKFTEKGRIYIRVMLTESYESHLNLLFTVEDTGIGIPGDRIKEIFGSYTQARGSVQRKFGGTGLGTAIAKQLVELMHGEIWVESPSGLSREEEFPGSKFSFTLEAYSNERIPKLFDHKDITSLNDIKALVLTKESTPENHPMTRMLEKFGLQVSFKIYQDSNADSVVNHLDRHSGDYHLVALVDRNQLDGFALAREMKNQNLVNLFPLILVSSNDRTGNYKACRKLGIDSYLIEPFETKEVVDVLEEHFPGIEDWHLLDSMINALPESLSILLAEDNLINQKVAQSIFKNIGYEIEIAKNGSEALEMLEKNEYDVIFMDLLMPEMDGYEACEKIRESGNNIPIVALSANDDDETRNLAFESGMNDYMVKPARVESIKQLLIKQFSSSE